MTRDWKYAGFGWLNNIKYHLWQFNHKEGYVGVGVTHSKDVAPSGNGHYTGFDALKRKTGLTLTNPVI